MTPEQLSLELKNKTRIQQEEHSKKLIGNEIKVTGRILGIYKDYVSLYHEVPELPYDMRLSLNYEGEKIYKQLLEYSSGDLVSINATLRNIRFGEDYYFDCNIISIVRIDTRESREQAKREEEKRKNSSCFVATACYGSYDAKEVIILRHFRDEKLLKTNLGKIFIKVYYAISPYFAAIISKSDFLKKFVRENILKQIIKRLQ